MTRPEDARCGTCAAPWFEVKDGYPTEESLERLCACNKWDQDFWARFLVFDYPGIRAQMCGGESYVSVTPYFSVKTVEGVEIDTSTAGWSGVEDILSIVEETVASAFLRSWHRGGHYVFRVPLTCLPDRSLESLSGEHSAFARFAREKKE